MRIKIVGGFFLLIGLGMAVIGFNRPPGPLDAAHASEKSAAQAPSQAAQPAHDPPGIINGAVHPELIPDRVAYTMLFRLIANREEESAKRSIRAYVRQMFGCNECSKNRDFAAQAGVPPDSPDIDAFLAVAEEHHQRVTVLDRQAEKIKGRSWPDPAPEVMAKLTDLQSQNEALSAELVASLPNRISPEGMARLRHYIAERVKPGIKIAPGPQPPPDSKYYQPPPPAGVAPPGECHVH
jgi:hypothetical protein